MALNLLQKAMLKAHIRDSETAEAGALITTWAKRDVNTVSTAQLNMNKSFPIYQKKIRDELAQIAVANG